MTEVYNFTSAQAAGRMASVFAKLHSARSLVCATMEAFPIVQFEFVALRKVRGTEIKNRKQRQYKVDKTLHDDYQPNFKRFRTIWVAPLAPQG